MCNLHEYLMEGTLKIKLNTTLEDNKIPDEYVMMAMLEQDLEYLIGEAPWEIESFEIDDFKIDTVDGKLKNVIVQCPICFSDKIENKYEDEGDFNLPKQTGFHCQNCDHDFKIEEAFFNEKKEV